MSKMFAKGDEVMAKHPASLDYDKGRVVEVKTNSYRIRFLEGDEYNVAVNDVKSKRVSRSQTRTKSGKSPSRVSPGRRKSPGRPKRMSPARSPARSPGRSRKPRSPIETKLATISLPRIDTDRDYADETSTTDATESLEGSDLLPLQSRLNELKGVRRSTRLQYAAKADRATSLPLESKYSKETKDRGFSMQRERVPSLLQDDEPQLKEKVKKPDLTKSREWGGWFGTLVMSLVVPISFLAPQIACTNNRCRSTYFRMPKDWRVFFNPNAFYAYALYIVVVAILSIIPIGRLVDGQHLKSGTLKYRMNGLLSTIVILSGYAASVYKGYKVSDFIMDNMLQLTVCGWIYGLILAVGLYLKARKAPVANLNLYGSSHNFIYDFWQGREVNPRLGPLDLKFVIMRCGVIGSLLVNAAVLTRMIEKTNPLTVSNIDFVFVAAMIMHSIYLLDHFVFESMILTTFEINQEGTGYMLSMGYLMYPFISTLQTRFLLFNKTPLKLYLLIPCAIAFIAGYLIYRISNYQKHVFRVNPFSPAVSHLKSISTNRGKKLIVSGLWGHVRHPNYLGDLILHWSTALLILVTDVIPYVYLLICTFSLVTRVLRDNGRCKARYNVAWNEYCSRVKYRLIKGIF